MLVLQPLAVCTALSAATLTAAHLDQDSQLQEPLSLLATPEFSCHLPPIVDPFADGFPAAKSVFPDDEATILRQIERLRALVKIPSFSYDDTEPEDDPRWDVFYQIHDALAEQYPIIHARMARTKISKFGLVFELAGRNPSLRPLMLTGHQDVVLVSDPSHWTYPPFSGHYDGQKIWGRGASDDKNSITGIFSALEFLLSHPYWHPRRTIILALGFDEESSGRRGAGTITQYLEDKYGPQSMVMILDEGGLGLELLGGDTLYALPSVMEKGHINIYMNLTARGGHSSAPTPHTGIGIMAEIVVALETNVSFQPQLFKDSPTYNHLVCQARYSPDAAPDLTRLIRDGDLEALTEALVSIDRPTRYRVQTSQAVTLFFGGAKVNALPESIRIGINYRVAPQDSMAEIKDKAIDVVLPIVEKYNLTLKAFGDTFDKPAGVTADANYIDVLTLTTDQVTEVPRVSPTSDRVWDLFSGTIQHSFAFEGGRVVPVGETLIGNTDTRHYLNLATNIYRFVPTRKGWNQNIHAVDEAIEARAHMEALRFYYDIIRNFDASDL